MISDCKAIQLRQDWTINNFDDALELSPVGASMYSGIFTHEKMPDIKLQMHLYPNGNNDSNAGNVSLFLHMSTVPITKEFTIKTKYSLYFLDDASMPICKSNPTHDFKMCPPQGSRGRGWDIPKDEVAACIRQDKSLVIVCEIKVLPDISKLITQNTDKSKESSNELKGFLQRFHYLYKTGVGSDFVIECENKEFHVHKSFLIANSQVFRAMFTNEGTLEGMNGRVQLNDTTPTTVGQMLTYMYSGALPNDFADDAELLLKIADKYDIGSLKSLCKDKLIERLTKDNVLLMLSLADMYGAKKLMDACVSIIETNRNGLINSEDWAQLRKTNPSLIVCVLEHMVSPTQQKGMRVESNAQYSFCRLS